MIKSTQLAKQFIQHLRAEYPRLSVEQNLLELDDMHVQAESIHCKKTEYVFRQGEQVNSLWFLAYGLCRYVAISEDGKEFTKHFALSPGIVGSTRASHTCLPSQFGVQALSDCLLLKIDWPGFREALKIHPALSETYRHLLENLFIKKEQREYDLVLKSAEERYLNFQVEFKDVIHDIPLQYVASYIGVTPVALSRIRKRLEC